MTTITAGPHARTASARGRSPGAYWLAAVLAVVGVVAGSTLAWNTFLAGQRRVDSFDRVAIPGTMTVEVDEPEGLVVYYEGDANIGFDDLTLTVTDPAGRALIARRYSGEMVYETIDLTKGTAVATFDADLVGTYEVTVDGVAWGDLVVGESFARRTLPGVLGGLAIVAGSLLAAFVLVTVTFARRSMSRRDQGGQR
ncbi:MAG TPA: hypothetical protein VF230_01100 [Acidimicrobiales bacterium]